MAGIEQADRLAEAAAAAKAAEVGADDALAGREWRRYRLIAEAGRDPEDLLAEGVALSVAASTLISSAT